MLLRLTVILALVTTAAAAAPSTEMTADERAMLKENCTEDYMTYCGDLDPKGPEVKACFKQHMAELDAGCRNAIGAYEKARKKR